MKALVRLISLTLALAILACGCKGSPALVNEAGSDSAVNGQGDFPIVREPVTLRVFTPQSSYVEDYETNEFTLYYEELTNIHVEWDIVMRSNLADAVLIRLSSADLPDVFLQCAPTDAAIFHYGGAGVLVPLNNLIEEYGANTKRMMESAPYIVDSMVTPDGNIYYVPNIGEVLHATMPKKAWLYQPWLDALGLDTPWTTEEFYRVLKAFRTLDPNGNGVADEIPFAGAMEGHNEIESFLLQPFVFYDRSNYLMFENGTVSFTADTEDYREGLRYIRRLFEEELIAPGSYTQDRIALTALAEAPNGSLLGGATAMYWAHFTDASQSQRYRDYSAVPVLQGPFGKAYGYDRGYGPTIGSEIGAFAITSACAHPEAAMRWMDELYDAERMLTWDFNPSFGREGVDWIRNPPGVLGLDGRPAGYELILPFGARQNVHWSQTVNSYNSYQYRMLGAATDETETRLFEATSALYKPFSAYEYRVPFVFLTDEQNAQLGSLQKAINAVVQSYLVRFTTGALSIETQWEAYLRELEAVGVLRYTALIQEAVDQRFGQR